MSGPQLTILAVLIVTMALFLWGRWRHDLVAMGALLTCVLIGLVPTGVAFSGFGHPAVITVACVLVLGYGLQTSGAVDVLATHVLPAGAGATVSILALISLAALLSGFMNNVGALALLMPIALQQAERLGLPPGKVLMPLAFGSILGGMTTLIGTPPNLIVSSFRETAGHGNFSMFDFAPVGVVVALVGVAFVGLVGWRLVPSRERAGDLSFDSGAYLSEVRIVAGSKAVDRTLREVEAMLDETDAQVVGMVRREVRLFAPNPGRVLHHGDILVIEVEPEALGAVLSLLGVGLEEAIPAPSEAAAAAPASEPVAGAAAPPGDAPEPTPDERVAPSGPKTDEVVLQEWVVKSDAALVNRSATDIDLRGRYGLNLLAISREGQRTIRRLRTARIQAGDVLLMQGTPEALAGFAASYGCLPLAGRDIRVPRRGEALKATLIMALAVVLAALGWLPAAIAFAAAALAYVVLGLVPLRSVYTAIDWPVIILLAAMLPIADAMSTTGAADRIAHQLMALGQGEATVALIVVLVVTMVLTDFMNNAATAAVMSPIALSASQQMGVNPDTFLMAVAVGASCAFLTPIGHQNNTLILGPGGFRFGDYWRMGLPVDLLVVVVGVPMLLWVWPL